jgi:hypothetical protein
MHVQCSNETEKIEHYSGCQKGTVPKRIGSKGKETKRVTDKVAMILANQGIRFNIF